MKVRGFNELIVLLLVPSSVFAMEDPDNSYDFSISPENSLPPLPASPEPHYPSNPNQQYDPLQSRNTKYNFGLPPSPQSSSPSLVYGPPPPLPSTSLDYYNSYANSDFSLFDDCGPWKALSMILLVVGALIGVSLAAGLLDISVSEMFESQDSKINDPNFVSSVYEQIGDISRVLTSIKEATDKAKDE